MRTHRKPPPPDKRTWEAHSTYTADLGVPDRCRYRRTPPVSPTVADLVRPGDTVSTSYSTGGVVIEVKEYFYAAPTGEKLPHFAIVYVPPDRAANTAIPISIGSTSALPSETASLRLFEGNTNEVFTVDRVPRAEALPSRTILIS
jgi:hypothetical protein